MRLPRARWRRLIRCDNDSLARAGYLRSLIGLVFHEGQIHLHQPAFILPVHITLSQLHYLRLRCGDDGIILKIVPCDNSALRRGRELARGIKKKLQYPESETCW